MAYEDNRNKSNALQSDEVWNEIIRIRDNLGIIIEYAENDFFSLVDACDAFRIFMFRQLNSKWIYNSLDYFDLKRDIVTEKEKDYFKKLLDTLNSTEN